MIRTVATKPFADQKPGTSGLRKKVPVFQAAALSRKTSSSRSSIRSRALQGKTLVLGGDGRYFNREAIQIVVKIAAANGFGRIVDRQGRHPVDAGGLGAHPRTSAPLAASSCRRATIPAARTATSASNTTSATAARRRRRSPTRSSPAPRRSTPTRSPTRPTSIIDRLGATTARRRDGRDRRSGRRNICR